MKREDRIIDNYDMLILKKLQMVVSFTSTGNWTEKMKKICTWGKAIEK